MVYSVIWKRHTIHKCTCMMKVSIVFSVVFFYYSTFLNFFILCTTLNFCENEIYKIALHICEGESRNCIICLWSNLIITHCECCICFLGEGMSIFIIWETDIEYNFDTCSPTSIFYVVNRTEETNIEDGEKK